jgi:hypothetical protein
LQAFLAASVLPELAEAMVRVMRERPEDPIQFLAAQLRARSDEKIAMAEQKAKKRFMDLLNQ